MIRCWNRIILISFGIVFAWGCGGVPDDAPPADPALVLSLERVEFGRVAVGATAARSLVIHNLGSETVAIQAVELSGAPAFHLADGVAPAVLEAGHLIQVPIAFAPEDAGRFEGRLVVRSDDPGAPQTEARLDGEALAFSPCELLVLSEEIHFGRVLAGRHATERLMIRNDGAGACPILSLDLTAPEAFSLPGGPLVDQVLAPGESISVEVRFAPGTEGSFEGVIEVELDDPAMPGRSVHLVGEAAFHAVLLTQEALDFGTVQSGCASPAGRLCIHNTGVAELALEEARVMDDASHAGAFDLVAEPLGPVAIQPGGMTCLEVMFRPAATGVHTAALHLSIAPFDAPFTVDLLGEGTADALRVDTFALTPAAQADVLFVIDDSASMDAHQSASRENLEAFIGSLIEGGVDYHVGVITMNADEGGLRPTDGSGPRIVSPGLADPVGTLLENASVGTSGEPITRAFEAAARFFDPASSADPERNAGFLRDDAYLSLVFVSDKPEQSAGTLDHYLQLFEEVKDGPSRFSVSAVVGIEQGCGLAGPHPRYLELAQRTGGAVASICSDDWAVELLGESMMPLPSRARFDMTREPLPGTVDVIVRRGGAPVTLAWAYDAVANAVAFESGSLPAPGDEVEVRYEVACLP